MSKNHSDEYDEDDDGYEEDADEAYDEDEENENGDDEEDEDYDENNDDDSDDINEDDEESEDEDEGDESEDEYEDEEDEGLSTSDDEDVEVGEFSPDEEDEAGKAEEEDATPDYEEGLVYVIMPYTDKHLTEVFAAISGECSSLELNAQLASEGVGSSLVIQTIRDLTERAEFIVCDLTDERANVYYELGQAHGLGNDGSRVLLIAKQGTPLHFNVASLHVNYYQSTEHLRTVIASNLRRMIQATRE